MSQFAGMEKQLLDSPFWNKKLDVALRIRDADKDGMITRSDFEAPVKLFSEIEGIKKDKVDAYRRHIEELCEMHGLTDPFKGLSYNEAKRATAKLADDPNKIEMFTFMFNLLDMNQDGNISFDDWQICYRCIGANTAFAKASFEAMDTDGDGSVSLDEFRAYHCEFFFSTENTLNSGILYGPLD